MGSHLAKNETAAEGTGGGDPGLEAAETTLL